jgi:hypothetical protein
MGTDEAGQKAAIARRTRRTRGKENLLAAGRKERKARKERRDFLITDGKGWARIPEGENTRFYANWRKLTRTANTGGRVGAKAKKDYSHPPLRTLRRAQGGDGGVSGFWFPVETC